MATMLKPVLLSICLVGISCARTSRPAVVVPAVANAEPAFADPLGPDERGQGEGGEGQGPRITVLSATLGANCGVPEGNETANLAKLCDGRRRCEHMVRDSVSSSQWKGNAGVPCRPDYTVEWTCADGGTNHQLKSVRAEQTVSRLRLGCGPVSVPLPKVAPRPRAAKATTTTGDAPDTVRGRVIGRSGLGLPRRKVSLGTQVVITSGDGSFLFQHAPKAYDIRIAERDGLNVTAYLGLGTRQPVLVHTAEDSTLIDGRYQASIAGSLSADMPVLNSTERSTIRFLSPWVQPNRQGVGKVTVAGSGYGALDIFWQSEAAARSLLVALVSGGTYNQPWTSAYLATAPLSLADGDAVSVDLNLAPAASGRIAGKVQFWGTTSPIQEPETLRFSYVLPGWGELDLGECATKGNFDCVLPDLTALGGDYCMSIGGAGWGVRAVQCGGKIGMRDFEISAQPARPTLTLGSADDKLIAWTGQGGVYELNVGYSFGVSAYVYTDKTSFSSRDLTDLGIDFRRNDSRRIDEPRPGIHVGNVSIASLYPYASIDDLASGRGAMMMGTSWGKAISMVSDAILPESIKMEPSPEVPRFAPTHSGDLPPCASPGQAKPVGAIRTDMVDTQVALRGILTWDENWMCTLKGCDCCNMCGTHWVVLDPGGAGSGLVLQRAGDRSQLTFGALQCERPLAPRIEVVATGKLFPYGDPVSNRPQHLYLLDEASLCAVR